MFCVNPTYSASESESETFASFSSPPLFILPFGSKVAHKSDSLLSLTRINESCVDWRLDGWRLPQALIQKIILYRNLSG